MLGISLYSRITALEDDEVYEFVAVAAKDGSKEYGLFNTVAWFSRSAEPQCFGVDENGDTILESDDWKYHLRDMLKEVEHYHVMTLSNKNFIKIIRTGGKIAADSVQDKRAIEWYGQYTRSHTPYKEGWSTHQVTTQHHATIMAEEVNNMFGEEKTNMIFSHILATTPAAGRFIWSAGQGAEEKMREVQYGSAWGAW